MGRTVGMFTPLVPVPRLHGTDPYHSPSSSPPHRHPSPVYKSLDGCPRHSKSVEVRPQRGSGKEVFGTSGRDPGRYCCCDSRGRRDGLRSRRGRWECVVRYIGEGRSKITRLLSRSTPPPSPLPLQRRAGLRYDGDSKLVGVCESEKTRGRLVPTT